MGKLRMGTCSWKYPSWKGLVYSAAKGINYLGEYATKYRTVEVDQWFWSLFPGSAVSMPRLKDVEEYTRSVDPEFRFTIKVPNSITLSHYYKKKKSDPLHANPHFLSPELFAGFRQAINGLDQRIGPLVFQFEYLNKEKMPNQTLFLEQLSRFFGALPRQDLFAVEVRNPNYLNNDYFDFLESAGAFPVLMQGYWMPSIVELFRKWRARLIRHGTVVIRLHGADRKSMEERAGDRWDKIIEPLDDELAEIAELVDDLLAEGVDCYLNVNNHYEGSAPLTLERIKGLIKASEQNGPNPEE